MTDKELIEKAAQAAEIDLQLDDDGLLLWVDVGFLLPYSHKVWNPLANDGDALRLASSLGIRLEFADGWVVAYAGGKLSNMFSERISEDKYYATRRAITRAAAAMVKE